MVAARTVEWWRSQPRERRAERVSAATYGTVLILAALPLLDSSDVDSGAGWGLVTGVGLATWVAHAYAEVMGDHLRYGAQLDRRERRRAMRDGMPILAAATGPALALALGTRDLIEDAAALWAAVAVAILQLVGLGLFVGRSITTQRQPW